MGYLSMLLVLAGLSGPNFLSAQDAALKIVMAAELEQELFPKSLLEKKEVSGRSLNGGNCLVHLLRTPREIGIVVNTEPDQMDLFWVPRESVVSIFAGETRWGLGETKLVYGIRKQMDSLLSLHDRKSYLEVERSNVSNDFEIRIGTLPEFNEVVCSIDRE